MNIGELKEKIKDLPDEMPIGFICEECFWEYGQYDAVTKDIKAEVVNNDETKNIPTFCIHNIKE